MKLRSNTNGTSTSPDSDRRGLFPTETARGLIHLAGAMPPATRSFGKVLDTSELRPGDLLLSRYLRPDKVSKAVEKVQFVGGYSRRDAQWTHASMLTGARRVIEADLDRTFSGRVQERSIEDYCTGEHVLLVRRPLLLATEFDRADIVRFAQRRLHWRYAICSVICGAAKVARGHRFYHEATSSRRLSMTCSELYSYAYTEATGQKLRDRNDSCPPAFLSSSPAFVDIPVSWLQIVEDAQALHFCSSAPGTPNGILPDTASRRQHDRAHRIG